VSLIATNLEDPRSLKIDQSLNDVDFSNSFIITDSEIVEQEHFISQRLERSVDNDENGSKRENFHENHDDETREDKAETWIFESFKTDENGQMLLTREVPNSLTSWHISAMSFHSELRIAFSNLQAVEVSKHFFVTINFPLSIRFGELLNVHILVFNYIPDQKLPSEVDIIFSGDEDNEDFEFIDKTIDCSFIPSPGSERNQKISVEPNSQSVVSFTIRPIKSGLLKFKFQAKSDLNFSYEIEKTLKVLPETVTTFRTHSLLIDLRNESHFAHGFNLPIPEEAIGSSIEIEAIVCNLLEPLLQDATRLLST
jgi:uncharacterized protein YfaS (alpha-2-macroglobulin family)